MKRILAILLIIVMLPCTPVSAEQKVYIEGGFAYEVTDGEATIVFQPGDVTYNKNLVIPETLGGYPVTAIGWGVFEDYVINTVKLPPSVKRIEERAFGSFLSEINLENLEYMGRHAISISMEEIHIPAGCYFENAVASAPNLKRIIIGDGVVLTDRSFQDETSATTGGVPIEFFPKITDVEIGNNVTIGYESFRDLEQLKRVAIGDGCVIGVNSFTGARSLESLVLGNVQSIGSNAFGFASVLKEVTIPGSVTEIGDYAFRQCPKLEKIVVEEGVTTIGKEAFYSVSSLAELYLPKSLTLVKTSAFSSRNNYFVFYAGKRADWDAIEKKGTSLTGVADRDGILYNYYPIDPTYIPQYVNEITIMGKGTAYGRFFLKHINNTVAKCRTVSYSVNGNPKGTLLTDEDGYVVVSIDDITKSGEYVIEFTGMGIQTTQGILKVTVEPITFSSKYEAEIVHGANLGLAFGVGGSIGKLEAEAKLAEVGAEGSLRTGFSLEQEYKDGKNMLTLFTNRNIDVAANAELGLFAGVDIISAAGIDGSVGSVDGNISYGWSGGVGYRDEDFDPNDETDVENVARFTSAALLEGLGNNVTALYIADKINPPINMTEKGSAVSLEAGASVGVVELDGDGMYLDEASLASGGGKLLSKNSTVTLPDKSKKYSSSSATESGISFSSFSFKAKKDIASLSAGLSVWNNKAKNKLAFSAVEGSAGTLGEVAVTTEITEDNSFLFGKDVTVTKHTISYEDSAARAVVADYTPLANFAAGKKSHFEKPEAEKSANTMIYSGEIGDYTVSKEKQRGVDIELSGKLQLGVVLGGKLGVSGIESYEFEEYNGVYDRNAAFIQAHNDIESEVADRFITAEEALAIAYEKIKEVVSQCWDEARDWVDDNVIEKGKARIKKTLDDETNWLVSIVSPKEEQTYSVSTRGYEEDEATTLGAPYVVTVTDENGNEVQDLSQNPLEMTIGYDASEADGTPSVLYWDEDKGSYVKHDAVIDTKSCTAVFDITRGGQYLLATDNGYPQILEYDYFMQDNKPYLRARVSDFSGIDRIELTVNYNNKVVDKDNFEEYYNPTTNLFIYPIYEHMEQGGYANTQIVAYDSYDNQEWDSTSVYWHGSCISDITTTSLGSFVSGTPECKILFKNEGWDVFEVYLCCEVTDAYGNTYKTMVPAQEDEIDYNQTGLSTDYRSFSAKLPKVDEGSSIKWWYEICCKYYGIWTKSPAEQTVVLGSKGDCAIHISKIENDEVTVSRLGTEGEEVTEVILAVYSEGGSLVSIERAPIEGDKAVFKCIPQNSRIKAFLWNGFTPVCASAVVATPSNLY